MSLSGRLPLVCEQKNLSQDIEERTGLKLSDVSRLEHGRTLASLAMLVRRRPEDAARPHQRKRPQNARAFRFASDPPEKNVNRGEAGLAAKNPHGLADCGMLAVSSCRGSLSI